MEQIKFNQQQIQNTLRFIGETQSDEVKECIFSRLGYECFHATGFKEWLEQFRGKAEEYLKRVNDEHICMYWDSILPGKDGNSLVLTGAVTDKCVCPYAQGLDAPIALCDHCCRNFQRYLFGTLLDRNVDVEIKSSFLKGSDRCSTVIRF